MGVKSRAAGDSVQMGSLCHPLPIDDDDSDDSGVIYFCKIGAIYRATIIYNIYYIYIIYNSEVIFQLKFSADRNRRYGVSSSIFKINGG